MLESISSLLGFLKDTVTGMLGGEVKTIQKVQTVLPKIIAPPASNPAPTAVQNPNTPQSPIVRVGGLGVFNPNMIISDKEFLYCSSLTEAQIQDFIAFKGSFLKDYQINGHLPSYWIYKHCNDQGLNPKVLMTNIQKEQGTITTKTMPKNPRRLTYLCGVGAYESGLGSISKSLVQCKSMLEDIRTLLSYNFHIRIQPTSQNSGNSKF